MKAILILATALAFAAAPTSAQRTAKANEDGTLYCSNAETTVRELPNGGHAVNYSQALNGDPGKIRYAEGVPVLFDIPSPVVDLFYSAKWDDAAGAPEYFSASTITGTFGSWERGRERPADGLRIVIESGGLKSPPLTVATAARDGGYLSAALVSPRNALDDNDTEVEWDRVGALADSLIKRGGTLTLTDNGRVIATVQIPPSAPEAGRPAAVAFAVKALPFLSEGKCPR
ncbi:MAG: hypothetical protein ACAH11_15940 [Sphingomonas sp.]